MSYYDRRDGWSKCSNHDLHDWFIREGYTCLKSESESFVPFTMQAGWCIDYFGEYVNKRQSVRGSFTNGEDCAHAAIKEKDSMAAMYDTRTRQCTFVKELIEKADPNKGKNIECYIFLVGLNLITGLMFIFFYIRERRRTKHRPLLREVNKVFINC